MALSISGCGGQAQSETSADESKDTATVEVDPTVTTESIAEDQVVTFDGSGYSDTGAGVMYVVTPDGSTENMEAPKYIPQENELMGSIEVDTWDMEYTDAKVYVDGIEAGDFVTGDVQGTVMIQGKMLMPGKHKVELVAMDGDTVTIYKTGQYEVV